MHIRCGVCAAFDCVIRPFLVTAAMVSSSELCFSRSVRRSGFWAQKPTGCHHTFVSREQVYAKAAEMFNRTLKRPHVQLWLFHIYRWIVGLAVGWRCCSAAAEPAVFIAGSVGEHGAPL